MDQNKNAEPYPELPDAPKPAFDVAKFWQARQIQPPLGLEKPQELDPTHPVSWLHSQGSAKGWAEAEKYLMPIYDTFLKTPAEDYFDPLKRPTQELLDMGIDDVPPAWYGQIRQYIDYLNTYRTLPPTDAVDVMEIMAKDDVREFSEAAQAAEAVLGLRKRLGREEVKPIRERPAHESRFSDKKVVRDWKPGDGVHKA